MAETDKKAEAEFQAKFIGDPNDDFSGPSKMVWKGIEFRKGKFRGVPARHKTNLTAHTHFVVEGQKDPSAEVEADDKKEETENKKPGSGDKKWTVVELRSLLDSRGVKYASRDGSVALTKLAAETGGLPTE